MLVRFLTEQILYLDITFNYVNYFGAGPTRGSTCPVSGVDKTNITRVIRFLPTIQYLNGQRILGTFNSQIFLGKIYPSRLRIATDLLTLLVMCLIWAFQLSWLSTMIYRNFISVCSVIILSSMLRDIDAGLALLVNNIN